MWFLIIGGSLALFVAAILIVLKIKKQPQNFDLIIQHLDEKIFTGGSAQKKEGARQLMELLNSKINIQEAEELYAHKISLFYFERYDSRNDDLILYLTKFENEKVDFFDKIELYNFFSNEHQRYNKQNWVDGYAHHEIILNSRGKAIDYRFLDVNSDFEKLTGLKKSDIIGRTIKQVFPGIEDFWIQVYEKVATKGELKKFEHFDTSLNKYLSVTTYSPRPKQFISFLKEIKSKDHKKFNLSA